jgi:dTDP-D-glucose 4,6-dehydratase
MHSPVRSRCTFRFARPSPRPWCATRHPTEAAPETYLIGFGDERSNKQIVQLVLELIGQDRHGYDHVSDLPGHDLRYAYDTTKIRTELGAQPVYGDFRVGLAATID